MVTQPAETLVATLDEQLGRLVAFEPTQVPVLSVYLNTQPDQHGRDPEIIPYLEREFKALARTWATASEERKSFDRDVERIIEYTRERILPEANGIAIFACHGSNEFFEALQFSAPISEHRIYVYNQPHLYHLAKLDEEYPKCAAVLTDANRARIFVFGLGQTIDTEEIRGKKAHRVKVGGWSQARYQRRVENAHQQHAKEIVERLEGIVRDEGISRIILAGDPVIVPVIEQEMPRELSAKVEKIKLDIHAPEHDVLEATIAKLQDHEAATDAEKVARLFEEYRARGLAVVGAQETLETLVNGQVDELLISGSLEKDHPGEQVIQAVFAPEIPDSEGGTDSDEPRRASLPDLLVTKAKQTNASVSFIENSELLAPVEGVGAFLRWRS